MPSSWSRGRLDSEPAPTAGERFTPVAQLGGVRIESIVSSVAPEPGVYEQDHEEWVVVLLGSATLVVAGETVDLGAGEWVLLPARCEHEVRRTDPGTRWLAVHGPAAPHAE